MSKHHLADVSDPYAVYSQALWERHTGLINQVHSHQVLQRLQAHKGQIIQDHKLYR